MKIGILGAGNGGCAAAIDLALKGFDVVLCSAYRPEHIKPIIKRGGLEYSGELGEGFQRIRATNSVEEAVMGSELIMMTTPSTLHETYAMKASPYLKEGQLIHLNGCTTGGALNVARLLRERDKASIPVCEMNTLAYACRLQGPTHIRIYHRMDYLLLGVFPAKLGQEAYRVIREVYPGIELGENVMESSLSNLNAILHPPGMVLNAGWIEFTKGDFYFYSQGITPSIAKVIEGVDRERLTILDRLKLKKVGFVEHFYRHGMTKVEKGSVYDALQASEPDRFIRSPSSLSDRYLLEDIPYGLVPMSSIARQVGLNTPIIDSLIELSCILNQRDHWAEGLTSKRLGIEGFDLEDLRAYLQDGLRGA